jgi:hypothetical protein
MPPKKKKAANKKNVEEESVNKEAEKTIVEQPVSKRRTRRQKKEEEREEEDHEPEKSSSQQDENSLYPVLPEEPAVEEEPKKRKSKAKKPKPWQKKKEQEEAEEKQQQEGHEADQAPDEQDQKPAEEGDAETKSPVAVDQGKAPDVAGEQQVKVSETKQSTPSKKLKPNLEPEATPLVPLTKQNRKRPASLGTSPERRNKISKLNGTTDQIKARKQSAKDTSPAPTAGYKELEQQFNRLKNLRETEVEKTFREYREAAEKRDQAHGKMLQELRDRMDQEVQRAAANNDSGNSEELNEEIESLQSDLEEANNEIRRLQAKLAQTSNTGDSEQSLSLCSDLSGLTIQKVEPTEEGLVYDCLQNGRYGVLHYTLTDPQDENTDEITYTPQADNTEDILSQLPDYFLEPLSFSREAASQFYWKIAQSLNKK